MTADPANGAARGRTRQDAALLQAFEDASLPASSFSHREHLRVAWLYLTSGAHFEEAALAFCRSLRRYASSLGKTDLYHATITWAFLAIVSERQYECRALGFDEFAEANPDLFEPKLAPLLRFYDGETLRSDQARAVFLLPRPELARVT